MVAMQTPLERSPQDSAAASPLGRDAARAVIAARLRSLGHPPDLLDSQAIAALLEHAGGSALKLRAALAGTLFLASTEDAPRIGRVLVQRALQESEGPLAAPIATPRTGRRWLLAAPVLAGAGALALTLVLLLHRPTPRPALPVRPNPPAVSVPPDPPVMALPPRIAAVTPPAQTKVATPLPPAPEIAASPLPAASIPASPPPAASTPASSSPVASTPAPPSPAAAAEHQAAIGPVETVVAKPAPAPVDLPAAPPATAILLVSARDPAAYQHLDSLMQHLRAAGVGQIETRQGPATRPRRSISYFFADDLPLAQKVTAILADEGWPRLDGNALAPRLVLPPSGMPPRRPGLVEIQLP